jgi:chloramphenicol 3-O-phosphotransferase
VRAVLITGIPGAGKTTVARLLAQGLPHAAHIEGDVLSFEFVRSGRPTPGQTAAWSGLMELRRRQICFLADSYADAGFAPVIDDVVTNPGVLALYRAHLRIRPLLVVVLVPDARVVQTRDAGRDKHVFEGWAHLDEEVRTEMAGIGLHLDTSDLTAEETVAEILARADEATTLR